MSEHSQQVYLIRHGATEWSTSGKHTGLTDLPLIDEGRRNAERLRPHLREIDFARVITSPLQRARETCELAGLCEEAEEDADLVEWNYGDYEGVTSDQIHKDRPNWMVFTDGCPNGEMPADVGARVDRIIAKARAIDGNVALFAHGHVLRVLAARWTELTPEDGRHFKLDTSTVNILGYYHDSPAIVVWNAPLPSQSGT
jgi:broad specificity phosphatase PhoE